MDKIVILEGKEADLFCEELGIVPRSSKIMIKVGDKRAEYYNFLDDCFYRLNMEVALRYTSEK